MKPTGGTLTIHEVSRAYGLSVHTLRYYERIGLIHRVARASSGHRRYTEEDGQWLGFLNKLRATGMRIRDMRAYAALQRQGDASLGQRVEMLAALRDRTEARVAELTENLKLVRHKIEVYSEQLARPARTAHRPPGRRGGGRVTPTAAPPAPARRAPSAAWRG